MYQSNTDSSTEIPASLQAILDQQKQLIDLLLKQQQQQESQHTVVVELLTVQVSELQAQNEQLKQQLDQTQEHHQEQMAQLKQQVDQTQEYHQAQMTQRDQHHKELLIRLTDQDQTQVSSEDEMLDNNLPESLMPIIQAEPVVSEEVVPNKEILVLQFKNEPVPKNLTSLIELCETYSGLVVNKNGTDPEFSTKSEIAWRDFMDKALVHNENSKQLCFISKFKLTSVSHLNDLIGACATTYLKRLVIANCKRWSRLLGADSSMGDFLSIRSLIVAYGSGAALKVFSGNYPHDESEKRKEIERANRDAYLTVCKSPENENEYKAALRTALGKNDVALCQLLIEYGLGASDLRCEALFCERAVKPKKNSQGHWALSGLSLYRILFEKSGKYNHAPVKKSVDLTVDVLEMLWEKGYGKQAVACLNDDKFYTSLSAHDAVALFEKVPLCRLPVLWAIFLTKNHRHYYEDDAVVAKRKSDFESYFIQSVAKNHLPDLSELFACMDDVVTHSIIVRLLEVDKLHETYSELRQSNVIGDIDLLRQFCFSFDGVAKKEHLEKAKLLQAVDPNIYHVIHEILTKMQSATTPGSSKTFKAMLERFSKVEADDERQDQVYQALEHASKGSLAEEVKSIVATMKSAMKNILGDAFELSSDTQLQLLQTAFQSLLKISDQEGAVRVMAYIAPLMCQLTPIRKLQQYNPPVPKVPTAPTETTQSYGPNDRVSQFSRGDQGEVDEKVDAFTLS